MTRRSGRNCIEVEGWCLRKLDEDDYSRLGWYDCGDDEINDFFRNDAPPHKQELMAESYCFEYEDRPLALLSLQNDSIHFDDDGSRHRQNFGSKIGLPFKKRYDSLPAVKIGRLGVHKTVSKKGFGSRALDMCKRMFVDDNRTGCRLITVDAYVRRISFYEKNGFILFPYQATEELNEDDTVIMYYDLRRPHTFTE